MTARKHFTNLTEKQIDDAVIAQVDENSSWGEPVFVGPYDRSLPLRMPVDLLRRMSLQARKEGFSHVEDWVLNLVTAATSPGPQAYLVNETSPRYKTRESKISIKRDETQK